MCILFFTVTNTCLFFSVDSIIADSFRKASWPSPWETLNVAYSLCRSILYEVVNTRGKYIYDPQELAMDPKYIGLEWDNQEHSAVSTL